MPVSLIVIAVIAGVLNALQAGSNTSLGRTLDEPILAALIVTAVGSLVFVTAIPWVGFSLPTFEKISLVPWWAWAGGLLGGVYVLATILLAGRLGSALFTGLTVTAALLTSLVLDHFGWLGFEQHAAGAARIIGSALMIIGLGLIAFG